MKYKAISILSILIILLSTCTSDLYNPDICFQNDILPIFVTKCSMSGCHSATSKASGYDLTNYNGIMKGITSKHPLQSEIYKQISGNNPSMPVGQKLSAKEVSYIKIWIKMGAPNTSNCSSCDTSNYTFSGKIKPLLDIWCIGCHNVNNASGGYDLTTYSTVVSAIANNKLLGSVKHLTGFVEMPQSAPKLSDCDINAIEKWINANHPNN
jgi:hypothetical protein